MGERARKGTGRSMVPQNGAAIRAFRELILPTRSAFCRANGLLDSTLANIEAERRPASREMLERLAEGLEVPIAAITRTRDGGSDRQMQSGSDAVGERSRRDEFNDVASAFDAVLRDLGLASWLIGSLTDAARDRYLAVGTPSSLRQVAEEVIDGVSLPEVNRVALSPGRSRPHPEDWVIFGPWLTLREATQALGIKEASLWGQIVRGTVRSMGPPLLRRRIVNAHDIADLVTRHSSIRGARVLEPSSPTCE